MKLGGNMKLKKNFFLRLFFKAKEIKKIKRIDNMHAKNILSPKRLKRYITWFRIKSYLLFALLTVIAFIGGYYLSKYNILLKEGSFNDINLVIVRTIPVLLLILIFLELFVVYNKIFDVQGTLFNKQVKKCFLLSGFYLFLMIISTVVIGIITKNTTFLKTDLLLLFLGIVYVIKSAMDLISYAKMYLKAKI